MVEAQAVAEVPVAQAQPLALGLAFFRIQVGKDASSSNQFSKRISILNPKKTRISK